MSAWRRIVNFGGTSSAGTWYIYDTAGSGALDLALQGTVTQVLTVTNPPAIAPSFSLLTFTNNQFQFTITGTTGSNYLVQASTNLTAPNWTPDAPVRFIPVMTTFVPGRPLAGTMLEIEGAT